LRAVAASTWLMNNLLKRKKIRRSLKRNIKKLLL
jgi:hypothetical protein